MSRERMGLPIDRLVIATNVNDILARTLATGTYELRDVMPTASPSMDIQVSSNFERLLFEAYGRDAGAGARADGLARAVRPLLAVGARAVADPRACSPPTAPTRRRPPRPSAPCCARPASRSIRTPPSALRSPRRRRATRRCRWSCSRTAHPAKFPDAVEAACGVAAGAAGLACRSRSSGRSASTVLPADQARGRSNSSCAASRAAREGAAA